MRKFYIPLDILTVIGILIGVLSVLGGNYLSGGKLTALYNASALFIVLGGTIGAACLQTPWNVMKTIPSIVRWIVVPPKFNNEECVEKILSWSKMARKEGLLSLENMVTEETDIFYKKGLQFLVDGSQANSLRALLETDNDLTENRHLQAVHVVESMGGYAPTIGIIGAVMGLIHVMTNLEDPSKIGPGIATAFVATIYGVGLANLFFLPIASKLKSIIFQLVSERELFLEGLIAIADGEHPSHIKMRLDCYTDKKFFKQKQKIDPDLMDEIIS